MVTYTLTNATVKLIRSKLGTKRGPLLGLLYTSFTPFQTFMYTLEAPIGSARPGPNKQQHLHHVSCLSAKNLVNPFWLYFLFLR